MLDNFVNDLDNKRGKISILTLSTNDWKGWPVGERLMVGGSVDGWVSAWVRGSVGWWLQIRICVDSHSRC